MVCPIKYAFATLIGFIVAGFGAMASAAPHNFQTCKFSGDIP